MHRALHLSCKYHMAHQSQGQGQHSDWFGPWLEPREAGCSLPQFSHLQMESVTPPHLLTSMKATHQVLPGLNSSPVGSLKTTLASIVLRVRDLIITAMLGTLFLGSCFRAAWLQGEAFAEPAMSGL